MCVCFGVCLHLLVHALPAPLSLLLSCAGTPQVMYPSGTIAVAPEPGQMSLKEVADQIAAMEASGGSEVTEGGVSLAALKAMVTDVRVCICREQRRWEGRWGP